MRVKHAVVLLMLFSPLTWAGNIGVELGGISTALRRWPAVSRQNVCRVRPVLRA